MSRIQKLSRKKRLTLTLCLVALLGVFFGVTGAFLLRNNNPTVLVWAADKDVRVPDGLVSYLERSAKDDCRDYKGTGSVTGVSLFAIYDSAENRFAKMTYGCGNDLTSQVDGYLVAYKEGSKWNLTRPTHYFVNGSPECSFLSEHDIPVSIEQSCVDAKGLLRQR